MTATTMSSLMSCVSTLFPVWELPGDGGGVRCARAAGWPDVEEVDLRGLGRFARVMVGREDVSRVCERLTRFAGGSEEVVDVVVVGDGLGGDR